MSSLPPVLEFVGEQLYSTIRLDEVTVIACQHLLESNRQLFEALIQRGLSRERLFVIGKCYSTNTEVFERLRRSGIYVSDLSKAFDPTRPFDEQFAEYIQQFLGVIIPLVDVSTTRKIALLDDGGHLITAAKNLFLPEKVVAIEQTSSGYERLSNLSLPFPVMNVARSKAKLKVESPLIAELVVKQLKQRLMRYTIHSPNILIVGQGAIGRAIRDLLARDYAVSGCDSVKERCDFQGLFRSELDQFNVIVGATGTAVMTVEDIARITKPTLLISASSADREFPSAELRRRAFASDDCHEDLMIGKSILVNAGFPINFTGDEHSLLANDAQFTMGLLLAGLLSGLENTVAPGLCELDPTIQERIVSFFSQIRYNDFINS